MNQRLFLTIIGIITLGVLLILNAFLDTAHDFWVVVSACGIALVHTLSGFYMTRWAFGKPMKLFTGIVMGGMGIRFVSVAIALVLLIKFVQIDVKLFIVAFGVYYILFQIVEVYFINRGMQLRKINNP